jgi:hypothetical protein
VHGSPYAPTPLILILTLKAGPGRCDFDIQIRATSYILEWAEHLGVRVCGGWSKTLQPTERRASWGVRTGVVVQHDDTSHEHAWILLLIAVGRYQKVPEECCALMVMSWSLNISSSLFLRIINVERLFNLVTLFQIALTCPFCYIACGQLLVRHERSHVTTYALPYSLAAEPRTGFI